MSKSIAISSTPVIDPDDLFHREPLVAAFRVRGPETSEAFTFSLINFHSDPDEIDRELVFLPELLNIVRNDGREEDDVILLGDFNAGDREFAQFIFESGLHWAISHQPTNTRGSAQYDNLMFHDAATVEFTGRCGVFDFLSQYNMTARRSA